MYNKLKQDSLAILLLCTNLIKNENKKARPMSSKYWGKFSKILRESKFKSPASLFEASEEELVLELGLNKQEAQEIKESLSFGVELGIELDNLSNKGIRVTTRAEGDYPQRLKKTLKDMSPVVIYYAGNMDIINQKSIGIVGSRDVDEQGIVFTKKLAECAVNEKYVVVSGGARGVDSFSQQSALDHRGKVAVFLSTGISSYVRKKDVREKIMSGQLLVMSNAHPNMGFYATNAMNRNKYIYGLSNATFVVSSDYNKGGTWAGATENISYSWVKTFVRKSGDVPKGNEKLIEKGAIPVAEEELRLGMDKLLTKERKIEKTLEDLQVSLMDVAVQAVTEKQEIENKLDLYYIVIDQIVDFLRQEHSKNEMQEILNISKRQLEIWLERAINEQRIEKFKKKNKIFYRVKS